MKTGGTLNFLKRAGAIFMLIAVFASSCNKYADDFKQLNTKLDALATQVAGVTQLTTDMTALKSQVTALQTAVAGLPNVASITGLASALTAVSAKVDALTTTLNAVAASGTATKAVVDGLKTDLAALAAKVAKDNADAIAKLVAMDGKLDANQAAALKAINDQAAALSAKIAAETVAITGKVEAASAASAAAAAANLVQMAANQAALVAALNAMSAADAANLATLNAAIAALKSDVTAQLTAMTGANEANLATLLASNAALTAAMDAQFAAMTAANAADLAALQGSLGTTQAAIEAAMAANQAANEASFTSLLLAQAAESALAATRALETANALAQLIASQNDLIANTDANNTASAAAIAALQTLLDAQRVSLDIILDNTSMYNGDVSITSDVEVEFFMAKLAQSPSALGMVNGAGALAGAGPGLFSLVVNTANISNAKMADVNTICSRIKAVIGAGRASISFKAGDMLDFSDLAAVKGDLYVRGLASATGVIASGTDVNLSSLASVYAGGSLDLLYDGPYELTALTSVSMNLVLNDVPTTTVAPIQVGTTAINFPSVTVGGKLSSGGVLGVPTFGSVTGSIVAGGDMTVLTAAKALAVTLKNENYSGNLTLALAKATTVDLNACKNIQYVAPTTTAGGTLTITSAAGSTVSLNNFLGRNGATTAVREDITVTGPTTVSIPVWLEGTFTSTTAKTLTLGKNNWVYPAVAANLENLTLGAVGKSTVPGITVALTNYAKLITASVTGTDATLGMVGVQSKPNPALTTLTIAGSMYSAEVNGDAKLTSLTTSGIINMVQLIDCDALVGVNFGHQHKVTDQGSFLIVDGNLKLASLTTSTNKPWVLQVTNNAALATVNFASYTDFLLMDPVVVAPYAAKMNVIIKGNKFGGNYTNAVAATPTDGYKQSKLTCDALATLKPLFAAWDADLVSGAPTSNTGWRIELDLLNVTLTDELPAGTVATLGARMVADAAHILPFVYSAPIGSGIAADANSYKQLRAILQ